MLNKYFGTFILFYSSLISLILFSASTCKKDKHCPDGSHDLINLVNNSTKTINYRQFITDSIYKINGSQAAADRIINPNEKDTYGVRDCWESNFDDNSSLYFFFFDNDTVQAIGWNAISGTNRGLLKRVKVNLDYLKNSDFTISYP
jgi:hypothetical protein